MPGQKTERTKEPKVCAVSLFWILYFENKPILINQSSAIEVVIQITETQVVQRTIVMSK